MPLETSSNMTNATTDNNSSKRTRFADSGTESASATAPPVASNTKDAKKVTPLEAAQAVVTEYVETLHASLQPTISPLLQRVIKAFSSQWYKKEKLDEMQGAQEYLPGSVKFKCDLQPLAAIAQGEAFNTLQSQHLATIAECQLKLAENVIKCHALNYEALRRELIVNICIAMHQAAVGFIAEHDIESKYSPHSAVLDAFAKHRDHVLAPTPGVSPEYWLRQYKDTHKLTVLPLPTVEGDNTGLLCGIIARINGPSPEEVAEAARAAQAEAERVQAAAAAAAAAAANGAPAPPAGAAATEAAPTAAPAPSADAAAAPPAITPVVTRVNPYNRDTPATSGFVTGNGNPIAGVNARGAADEEMADDNDDDIAITGGKGIVIHALLQFIKDGVQAPTDAFRHTIANIKKGQRISRATRPPAMDATASRIAAALARQPAVDRRTLNGLVDERAAAVAQSIVDKKTNDATDLQRRLQAAEAKLANEKAKSAKLLKGKGGPAGKSNGSTAGNTSKKQQRARGGSKAGGNANATGAASKSKQPSRSSGKSNGKGGASNTKKNK